MAVVDEPQPDFSPGILPDLLLLLIDHGDGVVEQTNAEVHQNDGDDDLNIVLYRENKKSGSS